MPQTAIFGPFFATIFLTLVVWVYMYVRRISFIRGNGIGPRDLTIPGELARISPPEVSNPSDNLKNLFEIPVLFYALALVSSSRTRWTARTWAPRGSSSRFARFTAWSTAR
jgi:hypothetical protein